MNHSLNTKRPDLNKQIARAIAGALAKHPTKADKAGAKLATDETTGSMTWGGTTKGGKR